MDCQLCAAYQNEKERVVFEDEYTAVVLSYEPLKKGHFMLQPKRHIQNLSELTPEEASSYTRMIERSMTALTRALNETPIAFLNGWSFRSEGHLHMHVLPSKFSLRQLFSTAEGIPARVKREMPFLKEIADELRPFFDLP